MGGASLLTCRWVSNFITAPGKWLTILQNLWASVIISQTLGWCSFCWPSHLGRFSAPLILLLLAAWAASGGRERTARIGCVLLWPLALLLGAVLLSGIPEAKFENLRPTWHLPDAHLITVMLIPVLCSRDADKAKGKLLSGVLAFALLAAAVTAGILSPYVSSRADSPIYELSRSISLFGVAERFESLTAAAMTLGYFATISYLLSIPGEEEKGKQWIYALIAGLLFLSGIPIDSRIIAIGSILLWIVFPAIMSLKNIFQKDEKST